MCVRNPQGVWVRSATGTTGVPGGENLVNPRLNCSMPEPFVRPPAVQVHSIHFKHC